MDYRKTYSKLIRLGKDMTPEGANARNKAAMIKGKKIDDKDHRKTRKRNQGYGKGGICGNEETWKNLDKIIRDGDFYNYCYIPTKRIESPKMDAKYIPHIDTPSCPVCNLPNIDREPLLQKATGIRWYCWQCRGFFVKGSDGKFRKIIEVSQPIQTINDNDNDNDPSNPGNYQGQHKGKKIFGSGSNPPFGTPKNPRIVP